MNDRPLAEDEERSYRFGVNTQLVESGELSSCKFFFWTQIFSKAVTHNVVVIGWIHLLVQVWQIWGSSHGWILFSRNWMAMVASLWWEECTALSLEKDWVDVELSHKSKNWGNRWEFNYLTVMHQVSTSHRPFTCVVMITTMQWCSSHHKLATTHDHPSNSCSLWLMLLISCAGRQIQPVAATLCVITPWRDFCLDAAPNLPPLASWHQNMIILLAIFLPTNSQVLQKEAFSNSSFLCPFGHTA